MRHMKGAVAVCGSRGFATTAAIVLMGLIGVALLTLTAAVARDARRVRDEHDQAQARQILIAANALMLQGGETPKPIALPDALRQQGGEVTVAPDEDGQLRIAARVGRSRVAEVVKVAKGAGGRTMSNMRLD